MAGALAGALAEMDMIPTADTTRSRVWTTNGKMMNPAVKSRGGAQGELQSPREGGPCSWWKVGVQGKVQSPSETGQMVMPWGVGGWQERAVAC